MEYLIDDGDTESVPVAFVDKYINEINKLDVFARRAASAMDWCH